MKRVVLAFVLVCLAGSFCAAVRGRRKPAHQSQATFDYYLLALSWAPNYCAEHPNDRSVECRPGNHAAFVLHGLWPQSNHGKPPMNCAPARPVSSAIVRHMLQYFPSKGLIQHEWEKHGTCSGLSAADYFARAEQAFEQVKLPDQYKNLSRDQMLAVGDIEENFAAGNHAPSDAFRVSCHNKDLAGVEVCLTRDLKYRSCGETARECGVTPVLVRAPR